MSSVVWDDQRPFPIDHDGPVDRPFDAIGPEWTRRSLLDRFDYICARFPDRIAVDDGAVQLSFLELRLRAHALAADIAGVSPQDGPIAAVIAGTAVYPVALMACMVLGRPLAPIDVTHPYPRKAAILAETSPSLVLLAAGAELEPGLLPDQAPRLEIDLGRLVEDPPLLEPPSPDRLAGVAFTSGSTGRPKGLAYRQADMLAFVAEYVNSLHVNEDDVILALASLGAGGNLSILAALLTGAKVRMLDIKSAGIDGVLEVIRKDEVTLLSMVPVVFRGLLQAPGAREAVASLRAIVSGGDRLLGSDIALFRKVLPQGCAIRATQGSTETGVVFHWFVPPDAVFDAQETVPSGYPGLGVDVGLVEAPGIGAFEGEFLVRGEHLAAGGWQGGGLTPGSFLAALDRPRSKIYDTGDVARRSAEGLYEFIGRRDRQIKILGLRADPSDVEAILRKTPGVGDVVVIVRRTDDEAAFVAYVVPQDLHQPPEPDALQQAVAAEAPPHLTPAEVRFIPAIPRLPNYKPDLLALDALDRANRPRPAAEPAPDAQPAQAGAAVADAVRRAWSAILGRETHAEDRAWKLSGGDSMKALQFMLRLEEWLGRKLPLALFDAQLPPSGFVRKLTDYLAGGAEQARRGPLVFFCPGIAGDDTRLAHFRDSLASEMHFELVRYPDLEHSVAELSDPGFLVTTAVEQIQRSRPEGPIRLVGYSLGGLIAFELAARLKALGRTVERVCVIDTDASMRDARRWIDPTTLAREWAWFRGNVRDFGWSAAVQELIIRVLLRRQAFGLLRWLILMKNRKPGHRSVHARRLLLERLRGRGFLDWRPSRYDGELWLLRAEKQRNADAPPDLNWSAFVRSLRIVPTPGDHKSMLDPPQLHDLCEALSEAMGADGEAPATSRASG